MSHITQFKENITLEKLQNMHEKLKERFSYFFILTMTTFALFGVAFINLSLNITNTFLNIFLDVISFIFLFTILYFAFLIFLGFKNEY